MSAAKALLAVAGAVLIAVQQALEDDVFGQAEMLGIGIALLTAIGVYLVPNKPAPPPE